MSAQILIVDDEPNVRLNYRITLETEGYQVFEAASAERALEELWGDRLLWRFSICACRRWTVWSYWRRCERSESRFRR